MKTVTWTWTGVSLGGLLLVLGAPLVGACSKSSPPPPPPSTGGACYDPGGRLPPAELRRDGGGCRWELHRPEPRVPDHAMQLQLALSRDGGQHGRLGGRSAPAQAQRHRPPGPRRALHPGRRHRPGGQSEVLLRRGRRRQLQLAYRVRHDEQQGHDRRSTPDGRPLRDGLLLRQRRTSAGCRLPPSR